MHAEKKYSINAPMEKVWKLTSDPERLSQCIPGIKSFVEKDQKHFVAKVGTPFAFLKGTITMDMEVISLENHLAKIRIQGKSLGSTFEILTDKPSKLLLSVHSKLMSGSCVEAGRKRCEEQRHHADNQAVISRSHHLANSHYTGQPIETRQANNSH